MQTLPPSRSGLTTSTPDTGANAAEEPPHDLVYVRLEHAMLGQSGCPCRSVTSPVKLIVTWPQYEPLPIWDLGALNRIAFGTRLLLVDSGHNFTGQSPQAALHFERKWTIVDKSSHMLYQG